MLLNIAVYNHIYIHVGDAINMNYKWGDTSTHLTNLTFCQFDKQRITRAEPISFNQS